MVVTEKMEILAQLLEKALEGIKSVCSDAEIESVNLYDVPFNGCKSCFACKKINGRHYGKCVYKDDFKPILEEIVQADGVYWDLQFTLVM